MATSKTGVYPLGARQLSSLPSHKNKRGFLGAGLRRQLLRGRCNQVTGSVIAFLPREPGLCRRVRALLSGPSRLGSVAGSYSIRKHPSVCLFPFAYNRIFFFPPLL